MCTSTTPTDRAGLARRLPAALLTVIVMAPLVILGAYAVATRTGHVGMALVTSGSMTGYADLGDLVLTRRVDVDQIRVGDVLTVPKTETSDDRVEYVTHRVVSVAVDGSVATVRMQGDAVDDPDVEPYVIDGEAMRVHRVVPDVGRTVWWATHTPGLYFVLAAYLLLTVAYLCWPRRSERPEDQPATPEMENADA